MKIILLSDDAIRLEPIPGPDDDRGGRRRPELFALPHAGERAGDLHVLGHVRLGDACRARASTISPWKCDGHSPRIRTGSIR